MGAEYLDWGKRSTAEESTRVATTLEDNNNNGLLLCGRVDVITSLMKHVKILLA